MWLIAAFLVAWTFSGLFFENGAGARIPAMAFLEPVVSVMEMIVLVATVITFGAAVVAQVNRFRRGDAILRQQVKWLAADVAIGAVVLPLALVLTDSNPGVASAMSVIGILAAFALPIVIAIAILRYRLFELDRIISRTLGWAIVTAMLVATFAGLVVLLQTLLAPIVRESTLAVAASTLAAFALFQPLRRRVQRTVDRRFDRARYDGQRLAATFAERLRSEVDLAVLESSLAATAGEAVRPTGAAVWLSARRAR